MQTRISKIAATALIYKDNVMTGDVLGVSRKNDPNDFGLPGGKVDAGETLYDAMVREVKEETGLDIIKARPLFFREDGEFVAVVYLVESYEGEIFTKEAGVVKWVSFEDLKHGTFGSYNTKLEDHVNFIKTYNG